MKWFESEENNVEPRKNEEVKENSNEDFSCAFEKWEEKSTEKTEESEVHSEKEKLQEYKSLLLKYKEENEGGEQTDSTDDTESPKVKVLKMYNDEEEMMMQRKYMQDKGFHVKADEDMSELEETKSFDNIDANNVGESYDREMIKEPGERAQNLSENIIDESVETTKSENNEVDMADYVPDPRNEVLDEVVCAEKIEDSRDAVNENVGEMSEEQLNTVESEKTDYLELQEETSATEDYHHLIYDMVSRIDVLNNVVTNESFMQAISGLSDKIDNLAKNYDEKIKYDEGKQTTINRQYSELQSIREGIPYTYLKSIIKDIILTMTDLRRMTRSFKSKIEKGEELSLDHVIDTYASYEDDLLDILEKNGVTAYSYESEVYEPRKQKVIKIIDTDDEKMNKVIAERLMDGFIKTEYMQVEDPETKKKENCIYRKYY